MIMREATEDLHTNTATNDMQQRPMYPTGRSGSGRKKGVGVRPWLVLDSSGQAEMTETSKHTIMRRTGLKARDLRILDPQLSYPLNVRGRENAIVMNLEHIKAIITAQEVFLLNSKDPSVSPFIDQLQRRILCHHQSTYKPQEENSEGDSHTPRIDPSQAESAMPQLFRGQGSETKQDVKQSLENQDGSKVLPFEFVALEACLECACSSLENEALRLELEAYPALNKLTSKVTTLGLERVRQIKSRLVAINGRIQKVRDEVERLLDDDEDMAEMYLTEKLSQKHENSSTSSMNDESDTEEDDRLAPEANRDESYLQAKEGQSTVSRNSRGSHASSTRSVKELEMLLEAYFVQIDGTINKITTLREYVDDTEDYIKTIQDDKQNNLLEMGVKATTSTLFINVFIVVTGIFGMNINIEMFNDEESGPTIFLWIAIGCVLGWLLLYVGVIRWFKYMAWLH